jgi:hypothetical protein
VLGRNRPRFGSPVVEKSADHLIWESQIAQARRNSAFEVVKSSIVDTKERSIALASGSADNMRQCVGRQWP